MRALLWLRVSSEEQASDDKVSIEQQERDLRAAADKFGWQIVEVLAVPGFSAVFYNFPDFAHAAAAAGYDAGLRLLQHWERRDFDVLAYREGSRIGREQSILPEAVTRTIDGGARIYDLMYGWVDKSNYRMYSSMVSFGASTDIDKLKKYRDDGMTARAKKGLPTGSVVPLSHVVIRDDYGKALRLEVDERQRLLFDDLARVLVDGVGWVSIERVLHEQYGHAKRSEKYFYKLLHNPTLWGHSARFHRMKSGNPRRRAKGDELGAWAYDLSVTPPDGVLFFSNTHEAVYTGQQAQLVMDELRRRRTVIQGRMFPNNTHAFSGLLICGECGYTLGYHAEKAWPAYKCLSRDRRYAHTRTCTQRVYISEKKVRLWLDEKLREDTLPAVLFGESTPPVSLDTDIAQVQAAIAAAENAGTRLIQLQMRELGTLNSLLLEQMDAVSTELRTLQARLAVLQRRAAAEDPRAQQDALRQITADLTAFWQQPHQRINQRLHALFGERRMVVLNGAIVGTAVKFR